MVHDLLKFNLVETHPEEEGVRNENGGESRSTPSHDTVDRHRERNCKTQRALDSLIPRAKIRRG